MDIESLQLAVDLLGVQLRNQADILIRKSKSASSSKGRPVSQIKSCSVWDKAAVPSEVEAERQQKQFPKTRHIDSAPWIAI